MTINSNVGSPHSQTTVNIGEDDTRPKESDNNKRGRKRATAIEELGTGDKRWKRRAIENKSRQRSESLQLNDTAIEWGKLRHRLPYLW
jgi:hypothetical protein